MRSRLFRFLPLLALVVSVLLVGMLTGQRRMLRATVEEYRYNSEWPYAGLTVPTFQAITLTGDTVLIGETASQKPQILFIFNTECPFCLESLPFWKQTADAVSGAGLETEVYGISLDSLQETRTYASEHALNFPVVHFPTEKLVRLYHARGVPLTLVLDHNGTVLHAGIGSVKRKPAILDTLLLAVRRNASVTLRRD